MEFRNRAEHMSLFSVLPPYLSIYYENNLVAAAARAATLRTPHQRPPVRAIFSHGGAAPAAG